MLVKIHQTLLKAAITQVGRAASTRSTLPVLANVLITTEAEGIRLAATNLETTVATRCGCTVNEPGAITVPARLLGEVVGSLPAGEVTLETLDESCTLRVVCGASKTAIKGITAAEFPPLPEPAGEGTTIDAETLRRVIQLVEFAAATDEARAVLQGVNVVKGQAQAADGFRLAVCPVDLPDMLVARIGEVGRAAAGCKTVQVYPLAGSVLWRCGDTDVTIPRIDGLFPDVNQIMPRRYTVSITTDTAGLESEVKRARMFADVVSLDLAGNALTICAAGDGTGTYTGEVQVEGGVIPAVMYDSAAKTETFGIAQKMTVHLNGRFLADALAAAGQTVEIAINDAKSPLRITSPEVEGWTSILMPMHKD